ncbi:hypothetical protein D3C72_2107000 [compost metagenome]
MFFSEQVEDPPGNKAHVFDVNEDLFSIGIFNHSLTKCSDPNPLGQQWPFCEQFIPVSMGNKFIWC